MRPALPCSCRREVETGTRHPRQRNLAPTDRVNTAHEKATANSLQSHKSAEPPPCHERLFQGRDAACLDVKRENSCVPFRVSPRFEFQVGVSQMNDERRMTAVELMAKLKADAEYQRRDAEREESRKERQRTYDQALEPCLKSLRSFGLHGKSIQDIIKAYSPLPDVAVSTLLSSLTTLSEPRVQETIVRALGASRKPFDGRALVRCFEATDDESLRWAIANTIAITHPHSINDWLLELRKSPYWNKKLSDLEHAC